MTLTIEEVDEAIESHVARKFNRNVSIDDLYVEDVNGKPIDGVTQVSFRVDEQDEPPHRTQVVP